MKLIKFSWLLLGVLLFSCEKEALIADNAVEATQTEETNFSAKANIRTGRTRLKKRRNGLYKTVVIVENDPTNEVATVEFTLLPQSGVVPVQSTVVLVPKKIKPNGNVKFVNTEFELTGQYPVGMDLIGTVVQKNIAGDTIGSPELNSVKVKANAQLNLNTPVLLLNDDQETFNFRVAVSGKKAFKVANVNVMLTPNDGGSDADPEEFELVLTQEQVQSRTFMAEIVEFIESGNVVDMEYIAAVTFFDTNGEELDYAEFRITGLE